MIPIDKLPLDTVRELVRLVAAIATGNRPRPCQVKDQTILQLIDEELALQRAAAECLTFDADLPPRLRRVLPLLLQGVDIKCIAEVLNLSPYTVQEYVQDIYRHFGVCKRAQLQSLLAAGNAQKKS
ncbi:MAG: LuxR C-terminal-related transcriptional regulator [Planctomycetia bacterium]|jgi:DNA-binding NarL/FixJ family response regulator|nr:LuxR C-terminal-related transcriptional regulator [Planctomycetia bacterium]